MARRFLAALALAHGAAALLEGFVDVLVEVNEVRVVPDVFAGIMQAAAGSDNGYDACVAANDILTSCYNDALSAPTMPADGGNSCACCDDTTAISAVYASCASYALTNATEGYRVMSQVYSICANRVVCGTSGSARATAPGAPSSVRLPPACSSMLRIYSSCGADPDVRTATAPSDVAACFCPTESGSPNTAFEDYASSCAPFLRSSFPADYSIVTQLATYCEEYQDQPFTSTPRLVFTTVGTRTDGEFAFPSATSSTSSPTGDAQNPPGIADGTESTQTTSSSTGLAAPGLAVPGFVAWFANLATLFLSFFILI